MLHFSSNDTSMWIILLIHHVGYTQYTVLKTILLYLFQL